MEQGGFHGGLAFLSVAQETVVVRRERPECDGEMNNRLIDCKPHRHRKQTVSSRTCRGYAGFGGDPVGVW